MKTIYILLFMLSAMVSFARNRKEYRQMLKDRDRYVFAVKPLRHDFEDEVTANANADVFVVPVTIHGKTYSFLFDSGAPSAISLSLLKELQLKPVMSYTVNDASGAAEQSSFYTIDSLQFGNTTFGNIGVIAIDPDNFSRALCLKIDGIIGTNIMRTCNWKLDYVHAKVSFSDRSYTPEAGSLQLSFEESFSGAPEVEMKLGKFRFRATWDSGYNGGIMLPDSLYFKAFNNNNLPLTAVGHGQHLQTLFTGTAGARYYARPDTLLLGTMVLRHEPLDIAPAPSKQIGVAFMSRFPVVLWNWSSHTIVLQGRDITLPARADESYGFTPGLTEGKLKVVFLWEQSAAAEAGIVTGDEIIDINGKDTRQLSEEQWCAIRSDLKQLPDEIEVTTKRNQTVTKHLLKKRTLTQPE